MSPSAESYRKVRPLHPEPTAEYLWQHADMSYSDLARELGNSTPVAVREYVNRLGFRRPLRKPTGWAEGPCLSCGDRLATTELDPQQFKCASCTGKQKYPPARSLECLEPWDQALYQNELRNYLDRHGAQCRNGGYYRGLAYNPMIDPHMTGNVR